MLKSSYFDIKVESVYAHYDFNSGIVTQHEKALLTLLTQTITSFFLSLHQRRGGGGSIYTLCTLSHNSSNVWLLCI
jgi:hypothetical protein